VREEEEKMLDDLPGDILEKSIRILDSKNRKEKLVRVRKN